jgi:hypothetical protein
MIQLNRKQRFFTAMFLVAFLMAAAVSGEEITHRADLSVKDIRKRNETVKNSGNVDKSSTTTVKSETLALEIKVENRGKNSDTYQVIWASLAKQGFPDTKKIVFESKKKTITLDTKEVYTNTISLKPFVFTEESTTFKYWGGPTTRKGETYLGYIVLVMAGNEIIAKESNSSQFLKDEWIEKVKKAAGIL